MEKLALNGIPSIIRIIQEIEDISVPISHLLATAIGYKDYRNFKGLIEKAQKLCAQNSARFLFFSLFLWQGTDTPSKGSS